MVKDNPEESDSRANWRVIGKSVKGASHSLTDTPNQDSIRWHLNSETGLPLVVAVSDGHGSSKSFRSDRGSQIAAEIIVQTVKDELFSLDSESVNLSTLKFIVEDRLPKRIANGWRESVIADIKTNPYSLSELTLLGKEDLPAENQVDNLIPYGATALAVIITDSFAVYMQLGDGDILVVPRPVEVLKPIQRDERLFANETTSLCGQNAWQDFRITFQTLSDSPPAIIVVCTDGYSNSFREEKGFLKVGIDILNLISSMGLEDVDEALESWLIKTSHDGSGDDITVGVICCMDAISKFPPPTSLIKPSVGCTAMEIYNIHQEHFFNLDLKA